MPKAGFSRVVVSPRGQITLPASTRRSVGIEPGDTLSVTVEDDQIVLRPVEVVELERYSEQRIKEFSDAAEMTDEELSEARRKWRL